jgi:hypothetical protein
LYNQKESIQILSLNILLYDLETDPYENYDLSDNQPELVAKMEAIMSLWEKQMIANPEGIMNRM